MSMGSHGEITLTEENRVTPRKTCPIAALSTKIPTWIDPSANRELRSERPVNDEPEPWRGLRVPLKGAERTN
jgi:hypothetical protein